MKLATSLRAQFEEVLDTFQWAFPDRAENRGEITLDPHRDELVLEVWCHGSESPDDEQLHPLEVRMPFDAHSSRDPRALVRELIHFHLCHEADEQMWFGVPAERPFYPHEKG